MPYINPEEISPITNLVLAHTDIFLYNIHLYMYTTFTGKVMVAMRLDCMINQNAF